MTQLDTPSTGTVSRPSVRAKAALVLGFGAAAGVTLTYLTSHHLPAPICPLFALTGIYCPGCGSGRALMHLVQGDVAGAVQSNVLLVVVLLVAAAWAVAPRRISGIYARLYATRYFSLTIGLFLLVWTIARNLVPDLAPPVWTG